MGNIFFWLRKFWIFFFFFLIFNLLTSQIAWRQGYNFTWRVNIGIEKNSVQYRVDEKNRTRQKLSSCSKDFFFFRNIFFFTWKFLDFFFHFFLPKVGDDCCKKKMKKEKSKIFQLEKEIFSERKKKFLLFRTWTNTLWRQIFFSSALLY